MFATSRRRPSGSSLRGLRRLARDPDRTANAGPTQAAIAHRVLRQILLVIVLGEVKRRRIEDFRGDRTEAPRLELALIVRFRGLGGFALCGGERVDARAVLRAYVIALAHALGRVVVLPERLEQLFVGDLLRVIDHQHDPVVAGAAGADLLVGRVGRMAAGVTDGGDVNAITEFPELAFGAPEAAHAEHRGLEALGIRPLERSVQYEMLARGRDRRGTSGHGLRSRRHFETLCEGEHGWQLRWWLAHQRSAAPHPHASSSRSRHDIPSAQPSGARGFRESPQSSILAPRENAGPS